MKRFGLSWSERAAHLWERLFECKLRRRHRVKFSSEGRCIRCERQVHR